MSDGNFYNFGPFSTSQLHNTNSLAVALGVDADPDAIPSPTTRERSGRSDDKMRRTLTGL